MKNVFNVNTKQQKPQNVKIKLLKMKLICIINVEL